MFSLRSGSGGWGFEFQITHWSKTIIASRPSNVQIRMLETQIDKRARAGERANDGRREYSSTGSILTPTCLRFVFNSLLHPSASRCQLSPVAFVFDRGRWNNHNVYFRVYACVSRQQRFFFFFFSFLFSGCSPPWTHIVCSSTSSFRSGQRRATWNSRG